MSQKDKISSAVIRRLPRYYRYLTDLLDAGITRISSKELSEKMGTTSSQVRQDLNCFGGFGQQGYGYNVEYLRQEVGKILGTGKKFKVIIIGAGNIGTALANYGNLARRGFNLIGVFDVDPKLIGTCIREIKVMHIDELDEFLSKNNVDIAILSTPYKETAKMANKVSGLGVKGLWNFSAMDLKLPEDIIIENVHLSDSLMVLGYKLSNNLY